MRLFKGYFLSIIEVVSEHLFLFLSFASVDSDLSCESDLNRGGAIGPTQCEEAIAPDELQLSCRVTYNGQNAPQLVWKRAGDSTTLNKTICLTKVNRVTCNISVTANLQLNKSIYYCQSTNQKYNCSLELKNVLCK